ncbi:MAG: type IV toxin-antitoxin system AbiEi family antitoxin domain-containing protein [Bacteroidales bacterium]|nr:type IV toxin-antitoxin system AbiEi family antitoxin domain-containing protein [Bacteroidales bacterium]
MYNSVDDKIVKKIKKAKRGTLFFTDNFARIDNAKTVNKALERLVKSKELYRVARGIYVRPVKDKYIGIVLPDIDDIAKAIAKRDKARIVPTGSYALYKLGLTTQVPMNVVYYTDASPRKIKIGKQTITFKKTSAKNLAYIGDISKLVISALRNIGKDKITEEELKKIKILLKNEKPFHLQHDLNIAPHWIRELLKDLEK